MTEASDLVGEKPIGVTAEYPAHLPAVRGDLDTLANVVSCLIAHAVHITDHGEVMVEAEVLPVGEVPVTLCVLHGEPQKLAQEGPWAVLRVSSSHAPIAEHALRAMLSDEEGALGNLLTPSSLPSMRECGRVVEGLGGQLWVESAPGIGTRLSFSMQLQVTAAATTDTSPLREAVSEHMPERTEANGTVLLMVEDQAIGESLCLDFEQEGYLISLCTKAGEVLPLARRAKPDLILLDLLSLDPPAIDIALLLRHDRRTRNIPVLFITSTDAPHGGLRMEAVNFMLRPKGKRALMRAVKTALDSGLMPAGRVLVIEPEDDVRTTIVMAIQAEGYLVSEASRPGEALALAERDMPDMVLVNAELAHEQDYWLLRGFRRLTQEARIFVLADAITDAEGREAMDRGASGYSDIGRLHDLLSRVRQITGRDE
jgi:DNA-binding response OmpR family regulator